MQSNIADLYEQSKKRSMVRQLVFYLAGEQDMTLNFQALCEHIHIEDQIDVGIQMIPVRAILGCVRLHDSFDADFNPINDSVRSQWETIAGCVKHADYIEPIKVYQVGSHYFVDEGHVCVSVFRYLSIPLIDAHVTRLETQEVIRDTSEITMLAV